MTRGDQALESAADKLETFVQNAEREGGVKAKVGVAFADDPDFLRKLKPSLVKARMKGESPTAPIRTRTAPPPSAPKKPKPKGGGPSPWLVLGAAFAVGMLAAKALDWRGHAHPRW
ncbi:MAG TPA: hypothetical protein VGU02_13640 [Gaiellaceae bacterium]|nr:hypothetical protein [Gaiellaceae bacterium]